jgi:hypothetical protein
MLLQQTKSQYTLFQTMALRYTSSILIRLSSDFISVAQQPKSGLGRLIFRFLDHRQLDTRKLGLI